MICLLSALGSFPSLTLWQPNLSAPAVHATDYTAISPIFIMIEQLIFIITNGLFNLCEIVLITQFGTSARFLFDFDFCLLPINQAAAVVCKDFVSKLVAINRTRCRNP